VAAEVAYRAGDFAEAERCCVDGLATFSAKPIAWWRPYQVTALTRIAMIALARGDAAKCRAGLAEALQIAADWFEHPPLASVLDAIALYAVRTADANTDPANTDNANAHEGGADDANAAAAARLLGAAHTIRGAFDESSIDAPAARTAAEDILGEKEFGAAYTAGRDLTRDDTMALASSLVSP
jgi:hypothetical protein